MMPKDPKVLTGMMTQKLSGTKSALEGMGIPGQRNLHLGLQMLNLPPPLSLFKQHPKPNPPPPRESHHGHELNFPPMNSSSFENDYVTLFVDQPNGWIERSFIKNLSLYSLASQHNENVLCTVIYVYVARIFENL